jgi:hypothetical protein
MPSDEVEIKARDLLIPVLGETKAGALVGAMWNLGIRGYAPAQVPSKTIEK